MKIVTIEDVQRQFEEWLAQGKFFDPERYQLAVEERGGKHARLRIWTATQVYSITAHPARDGRKSYLGCTASARAPLPGESHTRGNDLADGPFSRETWVEILIDIVSYEAQPLSPTTGSYRKRLT